MIYLPGLGDLELQGDENKRVEPALTMLETGDFTIPYLAGNKYLSKPPLIYWLIAASCSLSGDGSEWSARLPSILAILFFVMIVMLSNSSFIPIDGRFMTSIIFLTTFGIITKGRQCEIEAIYTSLTGITLWMWLHSTKNNGLMDWKRGVLIGLVLGLGLLAKGPLILLFFYAPIMIYLTRKRNAMELLKPSYVLMVLTSVFIFLVWAVPLYLQTRLHSESGATSEWYVQMISRFNPRSFHPLKWIKEVLSSFAGFLPWLLLLPFMLRRRFLNSIERLPAFQACLWGALISFAIVNMMPAVRGRYTIPLISTFSISAGWFLCFQRGKAFFPHILEKRIPIMVWIGALTGVVMILVSILIFPIIKPFERKRAFGEMVNNCVSRDRQLYQYYADYGYQPFSYYIKGKPRYLHSPEDALAIPKEAQMLVRDKVFERLSRDERFASRNPKILKRLAYKRKVFFLVCFD
ncbi:MAG: phospholipid carrier-dependent glycosyltransferase [Kiritimatiellaeota bacterium]|nr:phospholipid carrier-dependent glycosyltransferase [Kiritimatiellota bacterium]